MALALSAYFVSLLDRVLLLVWLSSLHLNTCLTPRIAVLGLAAVLRVVVKRALAVRLIGVSDVNTEARGEEGASPPTIGTAAETLLETRL